MQSTQAAKQQAGSAGALLDTAPNPQGPGAVVDEALARQILELIFAKRRLIPDESVAEIDAEPDFAREAEPHLSKIRRAMARAEPIHLILPGFPAKSPNRQKTLGPLPDLAEKFALHNLYKLCHRIDEIYPPGTRFTICSDGRVFSDLVRIPDADVSAYGDYLKTYAREHYGDLFGFMDLDDVYTGIKDFDTLREELLVDYGEPIRQLRRRCREQAEAKAMYRGITRFLFEDYSGLDAFKNESRTAIQKHARAIAYRVIQRSNAWTRLLEAHLGDAIRLSVHPQYRVSNKIGVYLADADDNWLTPWHGVAVKHKDKITLRKRSEAQAIGLLAYVDGRPSHFELQDIGPRPWQPPIVNPGMARNGVRR